MKVTSILIFLMMLAMGLAGCLDDDDSDSDDSVDDEGDDLQLSMYGFEMDDHPDAVTSNDNDQLVVVTYMQGDDIEIPSEIQVELTVDGYSMEVCEYSSSGDGSDVDGPKCFYSVGDDSEPILWKVGETMIIGEVETNYCESPCNLQVEIRDGESEALRGETLTGTAE